MELFLNKIITDEDYKHRKRNLFRFDGDKCIMLLYDGTECIFDKEDLDIVSQHYWSINNVRHVCSKINGKTVSLPTYIYSCYGIELKDGLIIDHKDRNALNNSKTNFRACTPSQNGMNKSIQRNNTSGKTGVHYDKRINRYYAYIKINREHISLGYYKTFDEAVKVRKEAEHKYFGEFAPT